MPTYNSHSDLNCRKESKSGPLNLHPFPLFNRLTGNKLHCILCELHINVFFWLLPTCVFFSISCRCCCCRDFHFLFLTAVWLWGTWRENKEIRKTRLKADPINIFISAILWNSWVWQLSTNSVGAVETVSLFELCTLNKNKFWARQ